MAPLAVVIPALREAGRLPLLLADLAAAPPGLIAECLVVDGGSDDGTAALARLAGATTLISPPGRGLQLQRGVAASAAPWLLLLHADGRLNPGWAEAVQQAIARGEREPARPCAWHFDLAVEGPGLAAVPGLRVLRMENAPLKDEGMRHVGAMAGLEELSVRYTDVTNLGLVSLGGLKKLRALDLKGVDFSDDGLKTVAGMGQLEVLDLSYGRFTAAGFGVVAGLGNLRKLWLDQTRVNNDSMGVVAGLGKLESLSLEYTAVGDAGFAKLAGLRGMRELRLDHTELTDASVAVALGMTELRYLDIYHTSISVAGHGRLRGALPRCDINFDADSARRERRT